MTGKRRVRWGVLGAADIATKKVIPAMRASVSSQVVAIASRSGDKAKEAAETLGIPGWHGSYESLLADDQVEAVYIPLPNHLHAAWTIAAARAGKHVLCEKPLATSSADAQRMIEVCETAGVKLMEAFMYRLHPLWVETRRIIAEGLIGQPVAVQAVFTYRNVDPSDIRNRVETGGGALFDIGCYPVNLARMIFGGEPDTIEAVIRRDPDFGTDVLTSVILGFDGRHAGFVCSTQMEPDQRVVILGETGRLVIEIPFNIPPDRPTRVLHFAGGEPPVAPGLTVYDIAPADQYAVQAEVFSEAILSDLAVPTPPEDAVANLEVIEGIFAAGG